MNVEIPYITKRARDLKEVSGNESETPVKRSKICSRSSDGKGENCSYSFNSRGGLFSRRIFDEPAQDDRKHRKNACSACLPRNCGRSLSFTGRESRPHTAYMHPDLELKSRCRIFHNRFLSASPDIDSLCYNFNTLKFTSQLLNPLTVHKPHPIRVTSPKEFHLISA
ncbi:hypothetical protein AAMO2058_001191500 [Amorphochlora amoebiformis]|uniref:Uncharacterized protein n=1 Tax=Amorphochlora amoebiformis TaxID=1561963 RepID=A0A7S0CX45_9EUKA|mmetsp:Transcript_14928/g.23629  ORF Transcript_14928/g.23629 Transcript_14928/m.23629 type:complete len:167 (+) Transcript_14928:65-565(+)|eukprot:83875-Amorphochlora_amoeboformis.AAC.2